MPLHVMPTGCLVLQAALHPCTVLLSRFQLLALVNTCWHAQWCSAAAGWVGAMLFSCQSMLHAAQLHGQVQECRQPRVGSAISVGLGLQCMGLLGCSRAHFAVVGCVHQLVLKKHTCCCSSRVGGIISFLLNAVGSPTGVTWGQACSQRLALHAVSCVMFWCVVLCC